MQKDLEEFTKVVKEDTAAAYSTVAQKTFESINQYAGEQVANEAVGIKEVIFCQKSKVRPKMNILPKYRNVDQK